MSKLPYLLLVGGIVYTIISLVFRAQARRQGPVGDGRKKPAPAPLAPDDDPEFLWRLEQQHRRAERDAKHPDPGDDGSDQEHPGPRGTTS